MILRPSRDPSLTDWSVDASFGSRFESRSPGLKVKLQNAADHRGFIEGAIKLLEFATAFKAILSKVGFQMLDFIRL